MRTDQATAAKRKIKKVVGRAERVVFPDVSSAKVPARIDTGARTSTVWASRIVERGEGLEFCLFGEGSELFTGERIRVPVFGKIVVASSIGEPQERYLVSLLVRMKGKKIRAQFTLADRSKQVYPVLIGRNVLRGRFLVDVKRGHAEVEAEKKRISELQSRLTKGGQS